MSLVSQPKRDKLGHLTSSPSIYSCSLWYRSGVPTTYCINIILTSSKFFQYLILMEQNKSYKIKNPFVNEVASAFYLKRRCNSFGDKKTHFTVYGPHVFSRPRRKKGRSSILLLCGHCSR